MKNLTRILALALCGILLAAVSFSGQVRATKSADEEFVKFLEDAWVNAIVHKNINVLNHVIADDFIGTSPNGFRYTKQEAISDLQSGAYVVADMALDKVNVRVFGDTAIVTLYQTEKSRYGSENLSGRYAFTDVWLRRDGVWQAVASQGTPVVWP